MDLKTLKLENLEGIWILTVARPEALNALNSQVLSEMTSVIQHLDTLSAKEARALVITGSGDKAFVAGADIKEISELTPDKALDFAQRGQNLFQSFSRLKFPVIAAVNGFALGGGLELALGCDYIYASENAKFGLPEVSLGLIPGFGGTVRLTRAVGQRKAHEMVFTGDMITAADALACGLVNKVFPAGQLMAGVLKSMQSIFSRGPLAVAAAKKSMYDAEAVSIADGQKFEAQHFANLFKTQDVREGTKAFIEKRKAQFQGH